METCDALGQPSAPDMTLLFKCNAPISNTYVLHAYEILIAQGHILKIKKLSFHN